MEPTLMSKPQQQQQQQRRSLLASRQKQQLKAALAKSAARAATRKTGVAITTDTSTSAEKPANVNVSQVTDKVSKKKRKCTSDVANTDVQKSKKRTRNIANTSNNHSNSNNEDGLTALQQKMKKKLHGARFRWLNEQLYTTSGETSFKLFSEQPELFEQYHEGFRLQVEEWPENPLDRYIAELQSRTEQLTVADMGCGEAMLALRVGHAHHIHSFDLVAGNERITACDIANVPMEANSADMVIFCLSLMGTNCIDFIREAHRILRSGGELKVAEVKSRFTNINQFVEILTSIGFELQHKDDRNKMFIYFDFIKEKTTDTNKSTKKKAAKQKGAAKEKKTPQNNEVILKPCIYKRR